jgi:hypothetical protein
MKHMVLFEKIILSGTKESTLCGKRWDNTFMWSSASFDDDVCPACALIYSISKRDRLYYVLEETPR